MNFSVQIYKNKQLNIPSFVHAMDQYAELIASNQLFGAFEVFGSREDHIAMMETADPVRYCTVSLVNTYPSAHIVKIWKVSEELGIYSAEVKVSDDKMEVLYVGNAHFVPRLLGTRDNTVIKEDGSPNLCAERVITLDYVMNDPDVYAKFLNMHHKTHEGLIQTDALDYMRTERVGGIG